MTAAAPTMNAIVLHGPLREQFGGPFRLRVRTPAEAVRALMLLKPGFRQAVSQGTWRVVRGPLGRGQDLDAEELGVNLGGEMHLLPAPEGGKNSRGTVKTVIGAVLIVVAAALTWYAGGVGGAAAGGMTAMGETAAASTTIITGTGLSTSIGGVITTGQMAMLGIALLAGGISMMLAPTPTKRDGQSDRNYLLSGAVNQIEQGAPVPLVFGKTRTGSVVISAGIDIDVPTHGTVAGQAPQGVAGWLTLVNNLGGGA